MAVLETKVIQVANAPHIINQVNEEWGYFGWNVQNVQITNSQNTKTYTSALDYLSGNQTATVETTTINYATITYQRDKSIPNYARIVELEHLYEDTNAKIVSLLNDDSAKINWLVGIALLVFLWPAGIAYFIVKMKRKSTAKKQKPEQLETVNRLKKQLLDYSSEATTLLYT